MEDIKYTGQAEILKQRKRCTYFTQHIIILWHSSKDAAKAKTKHRFKNRLEKLMEKIPSRAAKHAAGEVTFSSGSPWATGCWESRATKRSLCIFQHRPFFPKPSICYVVVPPSLETGSQARWSFGLTHYGHCWFLLQQLTLLACCLSFAIQAGRAVLPQHPPIRWLL